MNSTQKPILIGVTVQSTERVPYLTPQGSLAQRALIVGESASREHSFTFQTGLLNPEQLQRCEDLQQHGFTVVELPDDWQWKYRGSEGWQEAVIRQAMKTMQELYENKEENRAMPGYDEQLAEEVLAALNTSFPYPITTAELKHALAKEPSDDSLLTALDALQLQGWISGKYLRSQRKLVAMANIQITAEGRKQLAYNPQQHTPSNVVHGDQINNYGQAGAIGRYATGTINYQQQWTAMQDQVDLNTLAVELEQVRTQVQRTASSRSDFVDLGLLAEAEEHAEKQEGGKVLETLSKAGRGLLGVAKEMGTDLAAKVIAKALRLEP